MLSGKCWRILTLTSPEKSESSGDQNCIQSSKNIICQNISRCPAQEKVTCTLSCEQTRDSYFTLFHIFIQEPIMSESKGYCAISIIINDFYNPFSTFYKNIAYNNLYQIGSCAARIKNTHWHISQT